MSYINTDKRKAARKIWWGKNGHKYKPTLNNRRRERRYEKKIRAIEYKGGMCEHCKQIFEYARTYDFHHPDPTQKDVSLGSGSDIFKRSWEKIKPEIDKCILLCANCHRVEHAKWDSDKTI